MGEHPVAQDVEGTHVDDEGHCADDAELEHLAIEGVEQGPESIEEAGAHGRCGGLGHARSLTWRGH